MNHISYWVMEEDQENEEALISMHPTEELATFAMLDRINEYKKQNPYHRVIQTNGLHDSYTANGLMWWRIKRYLIV